MNPKLVPYALLNNVSKRMHIIVTDMVTEARHPKDLGDLADMVLALKRCEAIVDFMKKEIRNSYQLMERLTCVACTELRITKTVEGEFATASPQIRFAMKLPKRDEDPEAYKAFLEHFGVSPELAESNLMKCDWPQMMEHLSNLQAMGKPLPPGVDGKRSYPLYALRSGLKKGIDDLEELLENESEINDGEES